MNRKITLFIILGLVLLLIPLFAAAEDDFKVTFSSTNVNPKEIITATVNNLNPENTVVSIKWAEKQYGFSKGSYSIKRKTLQIDSQTNTAIIKTGYGHEGWVEIQYKNQNGQTMVYTSDSVIINNVLEASYEMPYESEYMLLGKTYTVKYSIMGVQGSIHVKPYWNISYGKASATQYDDTIDISSDYSFTTSYSPTDQVENFDFGLHIIDDDEEQVFHDNHGVSISVTKPELWETAKYSWSSDNSKVDANRKYKPDESSSGFTINETAKTTSEIKDGVIIYTAQFKQEIFETQTKEVPLEPVDLSKAKISKISDQVYTGKSIKPEFTVKYKDRTLTEGTDYTVKWKDNKNPGKATVTIKGKGNNKGGQTATFKILPKPTELSSLKAGKKSLTVKWKKGSKIDGYEIQYSLKSNFKSAKKIEISGASTKKTEINGLKKKKTYYVRIRTYKEADGKKYYSEWSDPLEQKTK